MHRSGALCDGEINLTVRGARGGAEGQRGARQCLLQVLRSNRVTRVCPTDLAPLDACCFRKLTKSAVKVKVGFFGFFLVQMLLKSVPSPFIVCVVREPLAASPHPLTEVGVGGVTCPSQFLPPCVQAAGSICRWLYRGCCAHCPGAWGHLWFLVGVGDRSLLEPEAYTAAHPCTGHPAWPQGLATHWAHTPPFALAALAWVRSAAIHRGGPALRLQQHLCLSCNPQTRRREANSSLLRSCSAKGERRTPRRRPPRGGRHRGRSVLVPPGSAMAPSRQMRRVGQTV